MDGVASVGAELGKLEGDLSAAADDGEDGHGCSSIEADEGWGVDEMVTRSTDGATLHFRLNPNYYVKPSRASRPGPGGFASRPEASSLNDDDDSTIFSPQLPIAAKPIGSAPDVQTLFRESHVG